MKQLRDMWELTVIAVQILAILGSVLVGALWWFLRRTWAEMGVQRHVG
jgi:hypothetical protein